ncbi:MarR family winged helix-turn-helix transcriptional regulator [Sphingomonas koreensis]
MENGEVRTDAAEIELSIRSWPFYWLTRAMARYADSMTSALEGTGLDLPSWRVVMVLRGTGWLSVSEIASQSNTKLAAMTKTVQRMKSDGLVESREGETDRRVTLVSLTPSGEEVAEVAMEAARHVFRRAFHGMSAQQQETLSQLLREVAENLR